MRTSIRTLISAGLLAAVVYLQCPQWPAPDLIWAQRAIFFSQNVTGGCPGIGPFTDGLVTGSDLSSDANWTIPNGAFAIDSNNGASPNSASAQSVAYWNANSFSACANQYSQVVMTQTTATGFYFGPAVRVGAGSVQGYRCVSDSAGSVLQKMNGTTSNLGTGSAFTATHTIRLAITGTSLTCSDVTSSSTLITGSDGTWAGGQPGISGYDSSNLISGKSWQGASL